MSKFNTLLVLIFTIFTLFGCEKRSDTGVAKMHWDRDMCIRCKMAISERKFAVQVIDPITKRAYKFDDIGCAVLWFDEEKIPWREKAVIWITDAKTGEWIDAKKALYTDDSITPMAFGFAAFTKETAPKDRKLHDFEYVKKMIFEIERLNKKRVKE
jgi:nitrous oxide reductase accessory protein NosL